MQNLFRNLDKWRSPRFETHGPTGESKFSFLGLEKVSNLGLHAIEKIVLQKLELSAWFSKAGGFQRGARLAIIGHLNTKH